MDTVHYLGSSTPLDKFMDDYTGMHIRSMERSGISRLDLIYSSIGFYVDPDTVPDNFFFGWTSAPQRGFLNIYRKLNYRIMSANKPVLRGLGELVGKNGIELRCVAIAVPMFHDEHSAYSEVLAKCGVEDALTFFFGRISQSGPLSIGFAVWGAPKDEEGSPRVDIESGPLIYCDSGVVPQYVDKDLVASVVEGWSFGFHGGKITL